MAELQSILGAQISGGNQPQQVMGERPSVTSIPFVPTKATVGGMTQERDPNIQANIDDQAKIAFEVNKANAMMPTEVATQKQKKMDEANIKRQDFTKELGSFFSVDEAIPRGEGYFRFAEGLKSLGSAVGQENMRGVAVAAHDAASKKLRVSIARLKDVGNLSETEQKAAEQMLPGIFDSEKLVTVKRAYLRQLGEGIDSNSPDLVKQVIDSFVEGGNFKPEKAVPSQVQAKGSRFKVEVE